MTAVHAAIHGPLKSPRAYSRRRICRSSGHPVLQLNRRMYATRSSWDIMALDNWNAHVKRETRKAQNGAAIISQTIQGDSAKNFRSHKWFNDASRTLRVRQHFLNCRQLIQLMTCCKYLLCYVYIVMEHEWCWWIHIAPVHTPSFQEFTLEPVSSKVQI